MLRDTSGLTGNHIGLTDIVQKRCLTVVYVTHHGNDRRTWYEIFLIVLLFVYSFRHFGADIFSLETEFLGHNINGFCVQTLVDRYHDTQAHAGSDNLSNRNIHHRCQLISGYELCKFQDFAFCLALFHLLLHIGTSILTLLLTVFGTLVYLILAGKTCQGFLNLFCYVLFSNFSFYSRLLVFLLVMLTVLLRISGNIIVFLIRRSTLSPYSIHIDALFPHAYPFFLFTTLLSSSFFASSSISVFALQILMHPVLLLALFPSFVL